MNPTKGWKTSIKIRQPVNPYTLTIGRWGELLGVPVLKSLLFVAPSRNDSSLYHQTPIHRLNRTTTLVTTALVLHDMLHCIQRWRSCNDYLLSQSFCRRIMMDDFQQPSSRRRLSLHRLHTEPLYYTTWSACLTVSTIRLNACSDKNTNNRKSMYTNHFLFSFRHLYPPPHRNRLESGFKHSPFAILSGNGRWNQKLR